MSEELTNDVETEQTGGSALDRLVNREDVLQICYWFQGEGFGDTYNAMSLSTFLNCDTDAIGSALQELVTEGHLEEVADRNETFRFTSEGKKQGGRLFGDTFAEYSRQGHGECPDGCCDGDDHSQCGDACTLH